MVANVVAMGTHMNISCVPAYPPIQGISDALQLKRVI